jgi:hypothetical protein
MPEEKIDKETVKDLSLEFARIRQLVTAFQLSPAPWTTVGDGR